MLGRELSRSEKAIIGSSVHKKCANYDNEYGCMPMDSDCYMLKIGYTDSSLCKYYEKCILPTEIELQVHLQKMSGGMKACEICGNMFAVHKNQKYCSDACKAIAQRKGATERKRRQRRAKVENNNISVGA